MYDRRPLRTTANAMLPGNILVEVRTLDISAGGMAIVAPANPAIGTTFTIRVHVPLKPTGSATFDATVKVRNSVHGTAEGGFRIGLEFVHLDATARSAITKYMR
jgi:c-di-GMP-binding flagellar brake protein YcgR